MVKTTKKFMGRADIVFREMAHMKRLQRTLMPIKSWGHLCKELRKIHSRYPEAVVAQVHVELQVYGTKVIYGEDEDE